MSYLRHKQQGLSLVELMVALTLGMVLMAGFLQIFMSVRSTYAANEASSRLQENGRFALDFLAQHARMAGYRDPRQLDRPFPVMPRQGSGCTLPSANQASFCTVDRNVVTGAAAGEETGDRIAFVYQPPVDGAGKRFDCAGNPVPASHDDKNVINVFTTVATASSSGLVCRSILENGSSPLSGNIELVDGIDAVQFQYGLAPKGFVQQYVTASDVTNWDHVAALRIAVLANSITPVSPPPPAKNYYLLDTGPYSFNDGKMRQVFTTTVYLRNSLQ